MSSDDEFDLGVLDLSVLNELPDLEALEKAASIVYRTMPETPQYRWPQLEDKLGLKLWLKHENHTPLGAFKVRGGLVYFEAMEDTLKDSNGVICATRGNHGQSVAFAASQYGIPVSIVVPKGNSREKNAAMKSLGARLIEYGDDFIASLEHAESLAEQEDLRMVPSFDMHLVAGVGTYSMELMRAVPELQVLYVPIGLGSGICGALAARKALNRSIEIVGVISAHARAYSESITQGQLVELPATTRIADGIACRRPHEPALAFIAAGVDRGYGR